MFLKSLEMLHACECKVASVVSNSLWPYGPQPARLLCPWGFSRQEYWRGCHFLLQGIFSTHGSNLCFLCVLHWQTASLPLSSVIQSCPTLCDLMNHSTPGLPVQHQFPEFTQTHIHRVSDNHPAFSSCPRSLPASESFPMSQLFTWGGQSTGVSA